MLIKPKLFCFLFKLSPFGKRVSFINIDTPCVRRRGVAKALKSRDHGYKTPTVRRDETRSIKDFNGMKSNPVKKGLFSRKL